MKELIALCVLCLMSGGPAQGGDIKKQSLPSEVSITANTELDAANLSTKKLEDVEYQIPELWSKDVKEIGDSTFYYYNNLVFSVQCEDADFTNEYLISGADEFVYGLEVGLGECSDSATNIIQLSEREAIEFSTNVKIDDEILNVKYLVFVYQGKQYGFAMFADPEDAADYGQEYENLKKSIVFAG